MTKCSRLLTGHDQAAADYNKPPKPEELKADIKELDDWVEKIKKRKNPLYVTLAGAEGKDIECLIQHKIITRRRSR